MKKFIRFKDERFNKLYWSWISISNEKVQQVLSDSGSSMDMAFKHSYKGLPCKFMRSWTLYPVYIAGKEYKKVNKL